MNSLLSVCILLFLLKKEKEKFTSCPGFELNTATLLGSLLGLIKCIACLGKKFFQASVEPLCRPAVVSIYPSRLVCFRPSMTQLVNRRLSPLEFVRRILT